MQHCNTKTLMVSPKGGFVLLFLWGLWIVLRQRSRSEGTSGPPRQTDESREGGGVMPAKVEACL